MAISREALSGSRRPGCRYLAWGDMIAVSSHCVPPPITLTGHNEVPRTVQVPNESVEMAATAVSFSIFR